MLPENDDRASMAPEISAEETPAATEVQASEPEEKESKKEAKEIVTPATRKGSDENTPMFFFTGLTRFEYEALAREIIQQVEVARQRGEDLAILDTPWWEYFTTAGKTTVPFCDMGVKDLNDSDRDWRQLPANGRLKYEESSKINPIVHGEVLTGSRALRHGRQALSGGAPQNLPLVQSGFSISIKPPLEGDWSILDDTIIEQRKAFGWDSYGIGFSNYSVYLMQTVVDWALQFITGCSIKAPDGKTSPAELVRQYIDYYDLPVLLAYVAHASYPNGFNYTRPTLPVEDDNAVAYISEVLSLYHCVLHDWSRINEWQLEHLTKKAKGSVTVEEVLAYKELVQKERMSEPVNVTDLVRVELTTPSLTEVLHSTDSWLANLKETVMSGLTKNKTDGQRQEAIRNCSRLAQVRAFGAWVKAIHISDGNGNWAKVIDPADINEILIDTRNDTEVAKKLYKAVLQYMGRTQLSYVCVPMDPKLERMPSGLNADTDQRIIPIDILSMVFIQLEHVRAKRSM